MKVTVKRISSDKKVAEFIVGNITYIGFYNPNNTHILFETRSDSQILDYQNTKLSKKDYSRLLRKASAILAKR